MLPSFETAYNVFGHKKDVIANECGVTYRHFWTWAAGRNYCPKHKRQTIDRAFGTPVDWDQYEAEYTAKSRTAPQEAPKPLSPPATPPRGESSLLGDLWG